MRQAKASQWRPALVIAREAAKPRSPAEGAFDDPASGQQHKPTFGVIEFDDLQGEPMCGGGFRRGGAGITLVDISQGDGFAGRRSCAIISKRGVWQFQKLPDCGLNVHFVQALQAIDAINRDDLAILAILGFRLGVLGQLLVPISKFDYGVFPCVRGQLLVPMTTNSWSNRQLLSAEARVVWFGQLCFNSGVGQLMLPNS